MSKIISIQTGKKFLIKVNQKTHQGYVINTRNLNMFIVGKYFNSQVKLFSTISEGWQYIESFFQPDRNLFSIIEMEEEIKRLSDGKNFGAMTNEMYCIISHIENVTAKKMYIKKNFMKNLLFSAPDPVGSMIFLKPEAEKTMELIETEKQDIYSQYKIEIL